jgi:hypothetical protein
MVRIEIVGAVGLRLVEYADETQDTKEDLRNTFGRGFFQQNSIGVLRKTLNGDYQYLLTHGVPQAPPHELFS